MNRKKKGNKATLYELRRCGKLTAVISHHYDNSSEPKNSALAYTRIHTTFIIFWVIYIYT